MAASKQEPKKKLDSTRLIRKFRECRLKMKPTTRLVGMYLATNADWETFETKVSYKCLMHWTHLTKKSIVLAMEELRGLGILTSERRGGHRTNVTVFNIAKLEEVAVPFKQPDPVEEPGEEQSAKELQQEMCVHDWSPRGFCRECEMLKDDYDKQQAASQPAPEPIIPAEEDNPLPEYENPISRKEWQVRVERSQNCPTLKRTGSHHWASKGFCLICETKKEDWERIQQESELSEISSSFEIED